jgi:hypothetical protein
LAGVVEACVDAIYLMEIDNQKEEEAKAEAEN